MVTDCANLPTPTCHLPARPSSRCVRLASEGYPTALALSQIEGKLRVRFILVRAPAEAPKYRAFRQRNCYCLMVNFSEKPLRDELEAACEIARAAGRVLRERFGTALRIDTKSSVADLVTEADLESERLITGQLRERFPGDGVIGEEGGRASAGARTWLVDPLDGTTNFAHGVPHFSISIALYAGTQGEVGVVYDPMRDELFSGSVHGRAELERHGRRLTLQVRENAALDQALVSTGFVRGKPNDWKNLDHFCRITPRVRGARRLGSAALDLSYVAAGRFDAHWESDLSAWDSAAGAVLVRAAGGQVTTLDGQPWDPWSRHLLAASPAMAPALLAELAADGAR